MELPAFVLLSSLAAVSFSAAATQLRMLWGWGLALLVTTVLLQRQIVILESAQVAMLIVMAVAICLGFPDHRRLSVVSGGILTAVWLYTLQLTGLPWFAAGFIAAGAAGLSVLLSCRRPTFCPEPLLLEARLIVLVAALLLAIVPGIISGWSAGLQMQTLYKADETQLTSPLVLILPLLSLAAGALYTQWKNR